MEDSDYRTIKLFMVALMAVGTLTLGLLVVTGNFGNASQFIQEAIYKGSGTLDVEILGEDQNARAAAHNSKNIDIQYKVTSDTNSYGESNKYMKVDYSVDGDGTRWTKFHYQSEAAGAGDMADFNSINGSFEASVTSTISVSDTGDVSFDSVVSAEEGNYMFRAKFYNIEDGAIRPTSGETVIGYGNFSIWRHINKTQIKTSNDWLQFCIDLNRDMILDESVPSGTYLVPDGYYVDEKGILYKIPEGYKYINDSLQPV